MLAQSRQKAVYSVVLSVPTSSVTSRLPPPHARHWRIRTYTTASL
jgi:hypothetical protein